MKTKQQKSRNHPRISNTARAAFIYLGAAAFCALFGIVYESFSHGVYSPFMIWAFAVPLALGAAPYFILWGLSELGRTNLIPCPHASYCYAFGIAALTCGSIMRGVLDIYGTTNRLISVYWIAGGVLTALGILFYLAQHILISRARRNY